MTTTPEADAARTSARRALAGRGLGPGRLAAGTALVLLLAVAACCLGERDVMRLVTPADALAVLLHRVPFLGRTVRDAGPTAVALVWEARVPRVVGAAFVGSLLALAGVAFQSLLGNPLADPFTVGVSSGCAVGSSAAIMAGVADGLAGFAGPACAFAAGLATAAGVYMLARVRGRVSATSFLLGGLVAGTFLWSLIPLALSLANRGDRQDRILAQLLGSLTDLGWGRDVALAVVFACVMALLLPLAAELNLMALGEESAAHLGVNVEPVKRRVIVAGALATAVAVSAAGIVAFVGLVVPHIGRRLLGPDHRALLPACVLIGAGLLVTADIASRALLNQLEIGVVTSLIGGPFFWWLLRRRLVSAA